MNAIQILRGMHADTKVRFKVILGIDDAQLANQEWLALQPLLKLHEEIEDQFVYGPLRQEFGPGTPLGDWEVRHDADVEFVEQLVEQSSQLAPGTPAWRMCVATIMDALSNHVMDEEGQIFGRVEQVWDAARLEQAGAQMQKLIDAPAQEPKTAPRARTARRRR
jgi:hypothetical protein